MASNFMAPAIPGEIPNVALKMEIINSPAKKKTIKKPLKKVCSECITTRFFKTLLSP